MIPPNKYAENRIGMILIPKRGLDDPGHTLSPAVRTRSLASSTARGVARSAPQLVPRPTHSAAPTLRKLGLVDHPSVEARVKANASLGKGIFRQLPHLGLTVAMFDNDGVAGQARNDLGADYDMVPDFRIGMMRPTARQAVDRSTGASTWPSVSGITKAHAKGVKGKGALVGVFDTGVDADHVEFGARPIDFTYVSFFPYDSQWGIRSVRGFDTHGHGTHVSGIIRGSSIGIAPEADLSVSAVIESETVTTSITRTIYALNKFYDNFLNQHAAKTAIVNMSLGFSAASLSPSSMDKQLKLLRRLLSDMLEANILPIVAVGNSGAGKADYPALFDEVLAVGAVDSELKRPKFSATGQSSSGRARPDIFGFGVDVVSSMERNAKGTSLYEEMSGTSMAAPYVTGIGALYLEAHPTLTAPELRDKLIQTATPDKVARFLDDTPPTTHTAKVPKAKAAAKRRRKKNGPKSGKKTGGRRGSH